VIVILCLGVWTEVIFATNMESLTWFFHHKYIKDLNDHQWKWYFNRFMSLPTNCETLCFKMLKMGCLRYFKLNVSYKQTGRSRIYRLSFWWSPTCSIDGAFKLTFFEFTFNQLDKSKLSRSALRRLRSSISDSHRLIKKLTYFFYCSRCIPMKLNFYKPIL